MLIEIFGLLFSIIVGTIGHFLYQWSGYNNIVGFFFAKDETTCVGGVNIYNAGDGNYDYIPELTCGTYHETVKLVDKVISDNDSGITHGSGLYQRVDGKFITDEQDLNTSSSEDFEYVFRGDDVNNYVKIDDNVWRIVSIDANNDMLLIFNEHSQRAIAWDDKYNEEEAKYQGVNTFESNGLESTAYKAIQEFYNGTLVLKDREMLSENGIVIISCTLDKNTKKILGGPEILTRGFIYVKESQDLLEETKQVSREVIEQSISGNTKRVDYAKIKNDVRDVLGKFFYKETESKPMIITVIQEI